MSKNSATGSHEDIPFWKRDLGALLRPKQKASPVPEIQPGPAPGLPIADFIPSTIRESIAARKARTVAVLLAVIVLAAAAGIWTWWSTELRSEEQALNAALQTNATVQARVNALTPVETLVRQVEAQSGLLEAARAAQPESVVVIDELRSAARTSAVVSLDSLSATFYPIPAPGEPLNPCPDPDPFANEIAIGCITFSASTDSRESISQFLQALEANPLFVGPFVNTSSIAAQVDTPASERVTFSGSVGVSTNGLRTPLSAEEIDAIVNPPEETAGDSGDDAETAAEGGEQQ
jgi:hypothetical protein